MSGLQFIRFLPLVFTASMVLATIFVYGMVVLKNDFDAPSPKVSLASASPPESCIFAFIANVNGLLLSIVCYIRYRQVRLYIEKSATNISEKINKISIFFGILAALGLGLLVNFQMANTFFTHIFFTVLCFGSGIVYAIIQTIFTRKVDKNNRRLFWTRAILCAIFIVSGLTHAISIIAVSELGENLKFVNDKVNEGEPDHENFLLSSCSEWIAILSCCLYVCTFHFDIRTLQIKKPKVHILASEHELDFYTMNSIKIRKS